MTRDIEYHSMYTDSKRKKCNVSSKPGKPIIQSFFTPEMLLSKEIKQGPTLPGQLEEKIKSILPGITVCVCVPLTLVV